MHVRVLLQKGLYLRSFMSGQVVENDMDLLSRLAAGYNLIQEGHKLLAGVPGRGLALHLAGAHIQGCIQRQCSVSIVLKTMAFDPT